jgi:hypothetical protein
MDDKKRDALERIIREVSESRTLAQAAGEGFLGYLLEAALHEARSVLIGAGHDAPPDAPRGGLRLVRTDDE